MHAADGENVKSLHQTANLELPEYELAMYTLKAMILFPKCIK